MKTWHWIAVAAVGVGAFLWWRKAHGVVTPIAPPAAPPPGAPLVAQYTPPAALSPLWKRAMTQKTAGVSQSEITAGSAWAASKGMINGWG
jgi:hypothetical protein